MTNIIPLNQAFGNQQDPQQQFTDQAAQNTPVWQRMLSGAGSDIVGMGTGIYNTAKDFATETMQKGVTNAIGDTAIKMGKGMVDEYGNLIGAQTNNGAPILDPNKSVFEPGGVNTSGINLSMKAAIDHVINHPINTLADIVPLVGAAKGLKGAMTPAVEAESPETASIASTIRGNAGKTASAADAVPDAAANAYLQPYTLPTRLGLKGVDAVQAAKQIIADGTPKVSDIGSFMDGIQEMKRAILGQAENQGIKVSLNNASTVASNLIDSMPDIANETKKIEAYKQEVGGLFPATGPEHTANPLEVMQSEADLRSRGWNLINQSKDATGHVTNFEKNGIGEVYVQTAKELQSSLDNAAKGVNIQKFTQDPAVQAALSKFSPQVAARIANTTNWSDLGSIMKPYRDMNEIANYSKASGNAALSNMVSSAGRFGAVAGGAALGSHLGPLGTALGAVGGGIIEPYLETLGNKVLPPISAGIASKAGDLGGIASAGASATKYGLPAIGGLSEAQQSASLGKPGIDNQYNSNSQQKIQTTPPTNNISTISQVPHTIDEIKPDNNGNYPNFDITQLKDAKNNPVIMNKDDYNNQVAQYTDQINQWKKQAADDSYKGSKVVNQDLAQAGIAQNNLDAATKKYNTSQEAIAKTSVVNGINSDISTIKSVLKGTNVDVFKSMKSLNDLATAYNGQYASLATYISDLQNNTDIQVFGKSNGALGSALDSQSKTIFNKLFQYLHSNYDSATSSTLGASTGGQLSNIPQTQGTLPNTGQTPTIPNTSWGNVQSNWQPTGQGFEGGAQ